MCPVAAIRELMKRNDIVYGIIFIALGIFIFTQTVCYPSLEKGHPGPGLFPNILAILFIIFGGVLIFKARKPSKQEDMSRNPFRSRKGFECIFCSGDYYCLCRGLRFHRVFC